MIESFANSLLGTGHVPVVAAVIAIALGLLESFLGYRIFKVQVAIVAFLGGLGIGIEVMTLLFNILWLSIVVGVLLGVLLAFISIKIYKIGVFLLVGFFTFSAVFGFTLNIWIALVAGVVVGIIGVFLTRTIIILVTAFGGGNVIASGIGGLIWGSAAATPLWLSLVILVVVGVLGCIVQFRTTKNGD